jgi:hypothetical protein
MNSKKAKQYIDTLEFEHIGIAKHAVELAEAEIKERAMMAFRFSCPCFKNGKCIAGQEIGKDWECDSDCHQTGLFIRLIDGSKNEKP